MYPNLLYHFFDLLFRKVLAGIFDAFISQDAKIFIIDGLEMALVSFFVCVFFFFRDFGVAEEAHSFF